MKASAVAVVLLAQLLAREPPRRVAQRTTAVDTPMGAVSREARRVAWAAALPLVQVVGPVPGAIASLRLYAADGSIDEQARTRFEEIASRDADRHVLSPRLLQLVFKAAYHFGGARVVVVSGWREHAGRHTAGEALDFKLGGVRAARLASWLRGLARVGVGVYTSPRTQYVHLDVRDRSYHWIDASPPGVTWKERQLRDPGQVRRDAAWTPGDDLPT